MAIRPWYTAVLQSELFSYIGGIGLEVGALLAV